MLAKRGRWDGEKTRIMDIIVKIMTRASKIRTKKESSRREIRSAKRFRGGDWSVASRLYHPANIIFSARAVTSLARQLMIICMRTLKSITGQKGSEKEGGGGGGLTNKFNVGCKETTRALYLRVVFFNVSILKQFRVRHYLKYIWIRRRVEDSARKKRRAVSEDGFIAVKCNPLVTQI